MLDSGSRNSDTKPRGDSMAWGGLVFPEAAQKLVGPELGRTGVGSALGGSARPGPHTPCYVVLWSSLRVPAPGTRVNPLSRLRRSCSISTLQKKKAAAQTGPAGLQCFQHFSDPRARTRLLPPGPWPPSGLRHPQTPSILVGGSCSWQSSWKGGGAWRWRLKGRWLPDLPPAS